MNVALGWGLALGAGVFVSWVAYPSGALSRLRPLLMALRVVAVLAVVSLLLDLPVGVARPPAPLVALDVSASWQRSSDANVWRAVGDSTRAASVASADIVLFGDSVRSGDIAAQPQDLATLVAPVVQRAAAAGQRVVVVTDGGIDDADALSQALPGSRLIVVPPFANADRAVADISAPAEGRVGDTVRVQARIVAGGAVATVGTLRWMLDTKVLAESPVSELAAAGEEVVEGRLVIPPGDSVAVLRAVLAAGGDGEARNDTLAIAFRRGVRQRVVIVSSAPDADVRDVATALRANIALPTDVFFRVAPARWVRDNDFTPVEESAVRAAVRGATLAVLHGDTTVLGAPSSLNTRSLLLLSPASPDAPELMVRPAASSPLQAGLAGIVVESLPPLMASVPARGGAVALSAAPGGAPTGATAIVATTDGDVRRVVISASGYGRWRARGGVSAAAFQALIGASTDWLLGARGRAAVATPATAVVRAGAAVRWRRGADARSEVALARDGDRVIRRDTLVFGAGAEATMKPLAIGVWRGTIDGVPIVIPVSASREWLPHASTLRSGLLNGDALAVRRGARSLGWLYLATVLLLAAEWLLRRRAGLR